ncbi:MAG: hypothetical protein QNJ91_17985 [Gammaproteobacteria bacterium]|nr:hypothetical protein [Gammaproteobacteria bacterium]
MAHVIDTRGLLEEGWLTEPQAEEIARRSRATMVALTVNAVLTAGIIAATLGLILWLADALAVAVCGALSLAVGAAVLAKGGDLFRMLGNAAAIIGAGMMIGGAGIELAEHYRHVAEPVMLIAGAAVAILSAACFQRGPDTFRFAFGSVALMGTALHLAGLGLVLEYAGNWAMVAAYAYTAVLIAAAGVLLDVRLVTALAIVPFAQMLDTGTAYFHAAYVFYSPEPTLTILQMGVLTGLCLWIGARLAERYARHTGILAIMAVIVGNLAFLVASLWGDTVGVSFYEMPFDPEMTWEQRHSAREAFEARFLHISEHVFTVVWAILLAGAAFWAAHANRRGLFNAAMTFGAIHGYTQVFETMGDEPMAWALAGLAAVPLAWGMWRLNEFLGARDPAPT